MSDDEFHAYVGLLVLSGLVLSVLAARGFGQTPFARVLDGLFSVGFLGYAGYLILAAPETVWVFYYAFLVPVLAVVHMWRAHRRARARRFAAGFTPQQPYAAPPAATPLTPFPPPPLPLGSEPPPEEPPREQHRTTYEPRPSGLPSSASPSSSPSPSSLSSAPSSPSPSSSLFSPSPSSSFESGRPDLPQRQPAPHTPAPSGLAGAREVSPGAYQPKPSGLHLPTPAEAALAPPDDPAARPPGLPTRTPGLSGVLSPADRSGLLTPADQSDPPTPGGLSGLLPSTPAGPSGLPAPASPSGLLPQTSAGSHGLPASGPASPIGRHSQGAGDLSTGSPARHAPGSAFSDPSSAGPRTNPRAYPATTHADPDTSFGPHTDPHASTPFGPDYGTSGQPTGPHAFSGAPSVPRVPGPDGPGWGREGAAGGEPTWDHQPSAARRESAASSEPTWDHQPPATRRESAASSEAAWDPQASPANDPNTGYFGYLRGNRETGGEANPGADWRDSPEPETWASRHADEPRAGYDDRQQSIPAWGRPESATGSYDEAPYVGTHSGEQPLYQQPYPTAAVHSEPRIPPPMGNSGYGYSADPRYSDYGRAGTTPAATEHYGYTEPSRDVAGHADAGYYSPAGRAGYDDPSYAGHQDETSPQTTPADHQFVHETSSRLRQPAYLGEYSLNEPPQPPDRGRHRASDAADPPEDWPPYRP